MFKNTPPGLKLCVALLLFSIVVYVVLAHFLYQHEHSSEQDTHSVL